MKPLLHKASKMLLLLLFAVVIDSAPLWSQVITSSLEGRVINTESEPVYSAIILAIHTESNTKYYAVANQFGYYRIDGLRPGGPYTVEIISMGYITAHYSEIYFDLAESHSLNAVLEFSSELLSGATIVAFRNEKMGVSSNISLDQNIYISTKNNNIADLLRYSPYSGKGISLAGADGRTTNLTIDGAQFNNNFGLGGELPGGGNPISIEAISHIQIDLTPYDVRHCDFFGGGINAITKSGTNTFTGTAYIYHRNEWTRGDIINGYKLSIERDKEPATTYGFTLGGPIIKDKLFFFTSFEIEAKPKEIDKWRASSDGIADEEAYISRTLGTDMEKVHYHVLEKYGYDTGSWGEYPRADDNIKALARIDWNISDKSKLSLRYNYTVHKAWKRTSPRAGDGGIRTKVARSSASSMVFSNSLYFNENYANSASLNLNSRITDKLHNDFLATFSHIGKTRNSPSEQFPFIDILQNSSFDCENYISLGYEPFTWNNRLINNTITVKNDLIYYGGKDRVTIGANYEYHIAKNSYMRNGTGYYRYSCLSDFLEGNEPEIVALTYGFNGETQPFAKIAFNKIGVYAQDDHSFGDNFKVSIGTRLDYISYSDSHLITNLHIHAIDYSGHGYHLNQGRTFTPQQEAQAIRFDTGHWPKNNFVLSPRIGFNWDLLPDKSLTISGGTGLFSGRIPLVFFVNMPTTNGTIQYQAVFNNSGWYGGSKVDMSLFRGGLITDSHGKPTIDALRNYIVSHKLAPNQSNETEVIPPLIAAVDSKLKLPQVWKSSIEVQYKVPVGFPLKISTDFVFNKTIIDLLVKDYSIRPIQTFQKFSGVDNRPLYPDHDRHPFYTKEDGTVQEVPSTYIFTNTNEGYGYMGSVRMETTPVKGLSISASYTHTASYNLTGMPDDHESSVVSYVPNVYGLNYIDLHPQINLVPDKVLSNISYSDKWGNYYALLLEGYRGGTSYSYMYEDDMNNDGYSYDLIYIPKDDDDILFNTDDDRRCFMSFVKRDKYLSKHQGEYAEAYAVYSPWVWHLDFNYAHNFSLKIGGNTHKFQINLDFKNILNLFNSGWGVTKILNPLLTDGYILRTKYITPDNRPVFETIPGITPTVKTWTPRPDVSECWYAKIGIKYFFN